MHPVRVSRLAYTNHIPTGSRQLEHGVSLNQVEVFFNRVGGGERLFPDGLRVRKLR